jgi:hypothetical protein
VRKLFLSSLFAVAVGIASAQAADIVVKTKPPATRVERRPPRPSPKHVWIGGYHKWDGRAYAWEPGRWEVPPREHAVWVAPKWQHSNDGYTFVEGRWR